MKYLVLFLLITLLGCSLQHPEIDIDPLSKSYLLEKVLVNTDTEKNAVFFVYPDFCGMCTENMVAFINSFYLDEYTTYVVLTEKNSITEKLSLPNRHVFFHDLFDLERHGLGFATGHLFLIENERIIYSHTVNDMEFDLVLTETASLVEGN